MYTISIAMATVAIVMATVAIVMAISIIMKLSSGFVRSQIMSVWIVSLTVDGIRTKIVCPVIIFVILFLFGGIHVFF